MAAPPMHAHVHKTDSEINILRCHSVLIFVGCQYLQNSLSNCQLLNSSLHPPSTPEPIIAPAFRHSSIKLETQRILGQSQSEVTARRAFKQIH